MKKPRKSRAILPGAICLINKACIINEACIINNACINYFSVTHILVNRFTCLEAIHLQAQKTALEIMPHHGYCPGFEERQAPVEAVPS